jgi:hypothetical protein
MRHAEPGGKIGNIYESTRSGEVVMGIRQLLNLILFAIAGPISGAIYAMIGHGLFWKDSTLDGTIGVGMIIGGIVGVMIGLIDWSTGLHR